MKKLTVKQIINIVIIASVSLIGALTLILPSILNSQKNLSMRQSSAADINQGTMYPISSCNVQIVIPTPTLTLTPTPTTILTPTPTPPLVCKNLDIGFVLDRSGTMQETESDGRRKLEWAKEAARLFVDAVINSNTTAVRISVDSFGAQGNENDPILGNLTLSSIYNSTLDSALSSDYVAVKNAITDIVHKKPGTCIQCGLNIANKQLISVTNKKAVILLSDGIANHIWTGQAPGRNVSAQRAVDQANEGRSKGIEYWVVGYSGKNSGIDETTLKRIACNDPNNCPNYTYKPDPVDWANTFLQILNELCE